ncbi:Arrestin-like protein [Armadillidium nasatum]|uniref:Arrestin-like protein n=1 Tax=Armadillidium nasatum TaxID=96803 RepID=A0A5N5T7P9_9CRUS|nr:Arrestin-like protein [Armadillidium nasatum]
MFTLDSVTIPSLRASQLIATYPDMKVYPVHRLNDMCVGFCNPIIKRSQLWSYDIKRHKRLPTLLFFSSSFTKIPLIYFKMVVQFKVFKKSSPNDKITLYMGHGIFVVDTDYLQGRKVFGQLVCSFRYGREDDEVMGLKFQKDLYLASEQIYPPRDVEPTKLQERLIKKLGGNAFPFTFNMPPIAPPSVTIQPGPDSEGKPAGVEYYIKIFVGDDEEDRAHKRSTILMNIRRIQFAPAKAGHKPCTMVRKDFMLSPGELEMEASLDKQLYYHGDQIAVNISIRNHSNKVVKKIKASVQQSTEICLFSGGQYRCAVASVETQEGCPVEPGSTLQKGLVLVTSFVKLKDPDNRDVFGMIISYSVKVKLFLGAMGGEVTAELPFVLMNPKPDLRKLMRADSQAQVEAFRSESFAASCDLGE